MKICCSPAGIQVTQLWAVVACGVLCIVLFWQVWWICIAMWAASGFLAAFGIKKWAGNICLELSGIELQLQTGKLFRSLRRQPIWNLTSVQILQTPLLCRTKSCFLLLYSTHSVWVVPAVDLEQAEKLALLPGNGGNAP